MIDKSVLDKWEHYLPRRVLSSFELVAADAAANAVLINISADLPIPPTTVGHMKNTLLIFVRDNLAHNVRKLFGSSLKSRDHKAGGSLSEQFAHHNQALLND